MIIGITGTVGAGKSGVATLLAGLVGCQLVDADEVCRRLLLPGEAAWLMLKQKMPIFFDAQGLLDRSVFRESVFSDKAMRLEVEQVLHPLVREEVTKRVEQARSDNRHLLIEVPLLFEVGWQDGMDCVISVFAPRELSLARVMRRDGVAQDQVQSILSLQLSAEEKARRADFVVDNSGGWAATCSQVSYLIRQLHIT